MNGRAASWWIANLIMLTLLIVAMKTPPNAGWHIGAQVLVIGFIWFGLVTALICLWPPLTQQLREQGPSVPLWTVNVYDCVVIVLLYALGWWLTLAVYVVNCALERYLLHTPAKPARPPLG